MPPTELDDLDRAILYHLQENGRKSITDIANAVDVANNTVRNRIDKLEAQGVIRGYSVDLHYDNANVPHHYIFMCTAPVSEREQLADEVSELDGVVEVVTLMTGESNVHIHAVGIEKDDITYLAYDIDDLGLRINSEHVVRDHVNLPYSGFAPDA